MLKLARINLLAQPSQFLANARQSIHLNSVCNLKKIEITKDEKKKTLVIEGKHLNSEETFGNKVLKWENNINTTNQSSHHTKPCAFCMLEKKNIFVQYTDVLVLRQFLTQDGVPLPKGVTGLCKKQHKKLLAMRNMAKQAGLILNLQPKLLDGSMPNMEMSKRDTYLKWNSYFDTYETKIKNKTKWY